MRNTKTGISLIAKAIEAHLKSGVTGLEKRNLEGLADLAATALHVKSVNTSDWISALPRDTGRKDSKEKYVLRFLANRNIHSVQVMPVLLSGLLSELSARGATAVLALDQSKLSDGFECLMVSLRIADRALPVLWRVVKTKGAIGFDIQKSLLDEVSAILPESVEIMLAADRFYGTRALVRYCTDKKWHYRIRLKGNLRFWHDGRDISAQEACSLGAKSLENAVFANSEVSTHIGILYEKRHLEPWFIAMDAKPTAYRIRDYSMRWGIECMFSDFKSRGFGITQTQLTTADRIERLLLVLTVGMYWAVSTGLTPDPEKEKVTQKNDVEC